MTDDKTIPHIEFINISKLTPLDNNPRKISKNQYAKLCDSLQDDPDFFLTRPCLVNKQGPLLTVYAGNQRLKAAKKMGWKQVPCIVEEDLDEKIMKSRIIKDNKTYGEFDFDILANEWEIDLLLASGFEPENLIGDEFKEIEAKEAKEETTKKSHTCPSCGMEF